MYFKQYYISNWLNTSFKSNASFQLNLKSIKRIWTNEHMFMIASFHQFQLDQEFGICCKTIVSFVWRLSVTASEREKSTEIHSLNQLYWELV